MRRIITLFILFFISLPSTASEKVVLQLKWYHQFQFAGFYMATEKGFYRDSGIEAVLKEGDPLLDVAAEVSSGNADFGVLGSELIIRKAEGENLKILSPLMQHSIRTLIARKESGISSIHDLAGKKLALNTNELPEFEAMFLNEGIILSDLDVEPKTTDSENLFAEGQIDALNGSIANQPFLFREKGVDFILIRPVTYGIDFYGDTLFASGDLCERNPDLVERFRRASLKGWDYALENPDETIEVIREVYGSAKSAELLRQEYDVLKNLIHPSLVEIGHNNEERWTHIADTYKRLGIITQDFTLEDLFFNPREREEARARLLSVTLAVLAGLLIAVMITGIIFNKRLSRQVLSREADIHGIIESMPLILAGIDSGASIIFWNSTAEETTGLPASEALGKNIFDMFPFLSDDQETILRYHHDSEIYRDHNRRYEENGNVVFRDINLYPIKSGKGKRSVLRIEDVSRQVLTTEALIHSEKMLTIGSMAAGMAHEINNPLAGIMQAATVIHNRILKNPESPANRKAAEEAGLKAESLRQYLEKRDIPRLFGDIDESGKRIAHIIKNFLSFSRKGPEIACLFNLPDLLGKALNLLSLEYDNQNRLDFSHIEILKAYDHNLPGIYSYREILLQVLLNILRNGAQAMHEAATEHPRLCINVTYSGEKGFAITVEDNGPGIPDRIIDKIFDPFFTTKESGEGTGLGLSLSYFLVKDSLNGNLSVESVPGSGAKFLIELPAGQAREPEYYI